MRACEKLAANGLFSVSCVDTGSGVAAGAVEAPVLRCVFWVFVVMVMELWWPRCFKFVAVVVPIETFPYPYLRILICCRFCSLYFLNMLLPNVVIECLLPF